MLTKEKLIDTCDVTYAMSVVGGKWKVPAIWELRSGPRRLSELCRAMPGVSESVLIIQLRELCKAGVLMRKDHGQMPPKVTYKLAPLGRELLEAISSLEAWGNRHRALQPRMHQRKNPSRSA